MRSRRIPWIAVLLVLAAACATGPKYRIWYDIAPETPSPQTKEDVTVALEYLGSDSETLGKNPCFAVPRNSLPSEVKGSFTATLREKDGVIWTLPFKDMLAFSVEVKNDTDHILRMGDARVFLVVGGQTYPALTVEQWLRAQQSHHEPTSLDYALLDQVHHHRDFRFISDLGTEILPGFSLRGYLAFDTPPTIAGGDVAFFDVTTKVDAAGNPVEKTKFTFGVARHQTQIK